MPPIAPLPRPQHKPQPPRKPRKRKSPRKMFFAKPYERYGAKLARELGPERAREYFTALAKRPRKPYVSLPAGDSLVKLEISLSAKKLATMRAIAARCGIPLRAVVRAAIDEAFEIWGETK